MSATDPASSPPDLAWLKALLWPDAVEVGATPGPSYAVIARKGQPRLVVPLDAKLAAAAATNRMSGDLSFGSALIRRLGGYGLRSGMLQPLLRARWTSPDESTTPSLETHFRDALMVDNIRLAVTVGPPRPNRKPVVELLSPGGETLGFAKIGWNGLTKHLVRQEAATLSNLDRPAMPNVTAPHVLSHSTWRDLEILALSPLIPRAGTGERRVPTADEVGQVAGIHPSSNDLLATSAYGSTQQARIGRCETDDAALLTTATTRCEAAMGAAPLTFAGWHGDWTPWNMIALPTNLLVWDWERATGPVPLGFDVIHYHFQSAWLQEGAAAVQAVGLAQDRSRAVLGDLGIPAAHVSTISLLYLLELFLRYAENADHGTDQLRASRHDQVRQAIRHLVGAAGEPPD